MLPIGTEVLYVCDYYNTGYVLIRYEDAEWYVNVGDERDSILASDLDAVRNQGTSGVMAVGANLHTTPSTTDTTNVIRYVKGGESIRILAENSTGSWCYICTERGEYGYMLTTKVQADAE